MIELFEARPIGLILTGDEACDCTTAKPLMEILIAAPNALLANMMATASKRARWSGVSGR